MWTGGWVARRLGVRLVDTGQTDLRALAGLALRLDTLRAHLLVSSVLGKYVPAPPAKAILAGEALGRAVAACLGEPPRCWFAETATALGHLVADVLDTLTRK
ncbi:phosphoribosyltransferase domain-containing protein [Solihabitans fulvus]|uniref:phosphoribosyltransferase domain-containing protein n=1 Tax=Solihabitans fulvus TaxID=1892852 RepID=UPI001CB764F3|nr:phosphoribosyltransferase domain-containing protein [Solihabitans fulvus]